MGLDGIVGSAHVSNQQHVEQQTDAAQKRVLHSSTPDSGGQSIGNLDSLREVDPEGYNAMMLAMASDINEDSKKSTERLEEIRKEYERQ